MHHEPVLGGFGEPDQGGGGEDQQQLARAAQGLQAHHEAVAQAVDAVA